MSVFSMVVMAGLDPAIHRTDDAAIVSMMDARAFAAPKGLRPRRRVEPAHDVSVCGGALPHPVIPGRAQREPGIHNHRREYGFRACALRAHPGMTNDRAFGVADSSFGAAPGSAPEFAAMTTETTTALEIAR
ncbi:hypothetical protein [Rhodopseudomonas palustris]|uniref:hypothetical protein n=1 Tax=Rhodopseudomonas palustris TaxID=1076 RepID=UPI0021F2ACAB|nr:hypothetical protein [Rhodopseudomonas palustris]UYO55818.1 hypothetical protein KQX61_10595 [Rhodopseudomonas palustris]